MLRNKSVGTAAGATRGVQPSTLRYQWLFPAASFCLAVLLGARNAVYAPDASSYRLLALGQRGAVPSPFSVRVLGPAAAGWLGRLTGLGIDRGFLLLGIGCLLVLLVSLTNLLRFRQIGAAIFAAIFLMPFWVNIFHNYYLPDLLHAAILAALLLCLAAGQITLAMLLLFPAYLARESTLLIAVCLVFAAWRRLPARAFWIGAVATLSGTLVSRHYGSLGAPNVQDIGGAPYMLGKVLWSFSRNILGLPLWTNTLPDCTPFWTAALPRGFHFGGIHLVGVCHPSLWGPARVLLSWFGIFGIGPAIAVAFWRSIEASGSISGHAWPRRDANPGKSMLDRVAASALQTAASALQTKEPPKPGPGGPPDGSVVVFRFSVIYGIVTLLITPLLGASTDRLVEYAWPLYFVALPWIGAAHPDWLHGKGKWILPLHLVTCWMAWSSFRWVAQDSPLNFAVGLIVLTLNLAAYFLLRSPRAVAQLA